MSEGSQIALVTEGRVTVQTFNLDGGCVSERVITDRALTSGCVGGCYPFLVRVIVDVMRGTTDSLKRHRLIRVVLGAIVRTYAFMSFDHVFVS